MTNQFSDVERRVKRYWYTDGIGELVGGGMFVLLGIYFAIQEFLGQNSIASVILQVGLMFFMIGGMFISQRIINTLKTHLTYPRTGYVEYQVNERNMRQRQILAGILGLIVAALTVVFVRLFHYFDSIVAVTAVIVALILVVMTVKSSGVPRFYFLGAISLAVGFALSISGLPNGYSLGLFYTSMGVAFIISGGLTLWHYLRENPLPAHTMDQNG